MPFDNYTDEVLVIHLASGSDQAFEVLYNRYWKRMMVKALALLQSEADAEEVVQNTFVNLWQRRGRLQLTHTFHTYISVAVKYEVLALVARKRKQAAIEVPELPEAADHSLQHWLDFEDLHKELEAAVNTLPEKCQLVFRLSRESNMSEREIADTLFISPKTVQAHMTKALKTLRVSLRYYFFSLFIL